MKFFWNKKPKYFNIDYNNIIFLLEKGENQCVEELLWQPLTNKIKYLPIVFDMIMKFKKPNTSISHLSIHKKFEKGKYELIVFEVPWLDNNIKFSPIVLDKSNSKIVGIMLPFNELHGILSKSDNSDIGKLGIEWTGFILSKQFGI